MRDIPAVQVLRHVWIQQYVTIDDQLRWRTPDEQPPGTLRQISPCDTDAPHLITNVITAPSPGSDYEATGQVQEPLASRELTPTVHLADKGYMSAHNLARADRRGIELLGPMMPDNAWQSAEGNGFGVSDFAIDWDNRVMTCPTGATSLPWASEIDQGGTPVIRVRFSMRDCRDCLSRDLCTRGTKADVSPCARERSMKLCNVPGRDKAPTNGSNATLTEQASRAPSHKVSQRLRPAAVALPRERQDPSPAPTHRRGDEPHQARRLADRNASGPDPHLSLRHSASSSMNRRFVLSAPGE
nr:hypothetical protein [Nonomuraea pusilla]